MRTSIFFAAPLVALVAAQESSANETSVLSTIPISSSSVPYTNGFTSFLTQTNSLGVVTGQPLPATSVGVAASNVGVAATNAAISSVAVQLVPAGLAPGTVTTLIYGNVTAGNATSIVVTVGASTTQVLSAAIVAATGSGSSTSGASGVAGASSSTGASASGSGSSSRASGSSASGTSTRASSSASGSQSASGSAASASSTGAAGTVKVGAGALIGAGVFFAAFL
ncbi:hypothetical protein E4T47_08842 [Aureobasidium subglaciale]|nr:hypothetical protein E4T43_08921 [Aureobasidium subglaciale]KAI5264105.1 hypothetical protein E4T47_08842 [Aureobasidium subglaciale]